MTGSYQGFSTSYTGLPESTSTFTLDLLGGSQQLTEKSPIFGKCCSHFALNIYHIYFNWIFHTHGDRFSKKFAVGAPIRIFLAFRICINFYSTLKIEPARQDLPLGAQGCPSGLIFVFLATFLKEKIWPFFENDNFRPLYAAIAHITT